MKHLNHNDVNLLLTLDYVNVVALWKCLFGIFQMKKKFEDWDPIKQPRYGLETMKSWKSILEDPTKQIQQEQGMMEPYERLVWDVWMPHIRTAVNDKWSARSSDSFIDMLESWLPIIPQWVTNNILEQLILPRLQKEVEGWNPLTDTMPIHAWIHPWLPLMGTYHAMVICI